MAARTGRTSHRLSALLACALTAGMVAGVAVASPKTFNRLVREAQRSVLGEHQGDERTGQERDPGAEGASGSLASDACDAIVEAYRSAAPPSDDVPALRHAIDVVRDNCDRNPQAGGLVNALQHQIANAERKAEHDRQHPHGGPGDHGGGPPTTHTDHGNGSGEHGNGGSHGPPA